MYKPTDWTKLLMWGQLAILATLVTCLIAAELGLIGESTAKPPPQYMKALALLFSLLGITTAALILRGRAAAWWLESAFLLPIAVFALSKIPEIRFGQTFTAFMDGFVKSFQVLFWATSPLQCVRIALSLRERHSAVPHTE